MKPINLLEDTKPYANTKLNEPLTDQEIELVLAYQKGEYPYCSPTVWRSMIAKGYIELRRYNEIWLTEKGERFSIPA